MAWDKSVKDRARALIHTSVDDCKASMPHITDVRVLKCALFIAEDFRHFTRAAVLRSRLNQLQKEERRASDVRPVKEGK